MLSFTFVRAARIMPVRWGWVAVCLSYREMITVREYLVLVILLFIDSTSLTRLITSFILLFQVCLL